MDRYGKSKKDFGQLEQLKKTTFEVEAKIFSILEIDPSDLQHLPLDVDHRIIEGSD
jgi:hypothetical protein